MTAQTQARAAAEPTLDRRPGMHYFVYRGILRATEVDRKGEVFHKGRKIPATEHAEYYLQHGVIFDAGGRALKESAIPKEVQAWRAVAIEQNPTPGVTHPGNVVSCTAPGCHYATCQQDAFVKHVGAHDMPDPERQRLISAALRGRRTYSMADFADPAGMLASREPPPGPGGDTPGPDEE